MVPGFGGSSVFQERLGRADLDAEEGTMSAALISTLALIYGGFSALGIAAGASILRKAGYSPWWVLTGFVPLVNIVMVIAFAFADWPVLQEIRRDHRLRTAQIAGDPRFTYSPAGPASTS
jgi:hypothetical protein